MRPPRWMLVLVAVLVAGCAGSAPPTEPSGPTTPATPSASVVSTPGPAPTPTATTPALPPPPTGENASAEANGFRIAGIVSVARFSSPHVVSVWLTVTNTGADARYAAPPSCRPERNPEIVLRDASGGLVEWRPFPQFACMVATPLVEFPAGASFEQRWSWNGTAYEDDAPFDSPPGRYAIKATFTAERSGEPLAANVTLHVDKA